MSLNFQALDQAKTLSVSYADVEKEVNGSTVKQLRQTLSFTQAELACLLHVSKKTIESWEEGNNPVQGASAVLIYLLSHEPNLSRRLFSVSANNACPIPTEFEPYVLSTDSAGNSIPFNATDPCFKIGREKMDDFVPEKGMSAREAPHGK